MGFDKKTISLSLMCMALLFLSAINNFAQEVKHIQLLDEDTAQPIQEATYQYGTQTGLSDEHGLISFSITPGEQMQLSHVNYGAWVWDEQTIQELIHQKVYYRKSIILSLQPATIIGLRPNQQPDDRINIDYQERMEHDGAAKIGRASCRERV